MKVSLYLIGRGFFILMLFSSCVLILSCKKDTNPGKNEVFIEGLAFNPPILTVPLNTTVTWRNRDGIEHTVTSDDELFDSGVIRDNGTFSTTFTMAGTFNYYCSLHTEMTGKIIVQAAEKSLD